MSNNSSLKVGMIGTGGIAGDHLRAYEQFPDRVQISAVCDLREDAARAYAAEAGGAEVYSDAAKMLSEAEIDAVSVCTRHDTHAALSIAAMETGRHVLVEKPMGCSLEECREMLASAERNGVILMVGQNQRYVPSYRGAHLLVQRGELGKVRAARCDAMQNLPDFVPGHWLHDGKLAGGGVVMALAVHSVDLLRYFAGDVARVTALTRTVREEFVNGAEDYALALLEFENGAIGELFSTFSGFRLPWVEQVTVFGDEGTIQTRPYFGDSPILDGATAATATQYSVQPQDWSEQFRGFTDVTPATDLASDDDMVNEVLHFADCCASGEEPISSGRDNLGTMKVVFGIYESSKAGRSIDLSEL